jgi:hypothetical protein
MEACMKLIFLCAFFSFALPAAQTSLPANLDILLTYCQGRVDNQTNPTLKKIATEHRKNRGQFFDQLRKSYAAQKIGFWDYLARPIANREKIAKYFQFLKMHPLAADLSSQEFKDMYWPILSAHIEYTYMAEGLAQEHTYCTRLLHGTNAYGSQNNLKKFARVNSALQKFNDDTIQLIGLISDAQSLTNICYEPSPCQEDLLINPTMTLIKAIHCIAYKKALTIVHNLVPLRKIDLLYQHNNRGNTLFHLLVEQHLPAPLFKSIARFLLEKEPELETNERNQERKTPLELAQEKNAPAEIIATIKALAGILNTEKTVQFTV